MVSALTKLLANKAIGHASADSADAFSKFFMANKGVKVAWSSRCFRVFRDRDEPLSVRSSKVDIYPNGAEIWRNAA